MKCNRKLYGTATVNDKGQIVIPADARRELGITPDMKLMIIGDPKRKVLALVPSNVFEKKMQGLMGLFFQSPKDSDHANPS